MSSIKKMPIWLKAILSTIGLPALLTAFIVVMIFDLLIVCSLKLWALLFYEDIEYKSFIFSRFGKSKM